MFISNAIFAKIAKILHCHTKGLSIDNRQSHPKALPIESLADVLPYLVTVLNTKTFGKQIAWFLLRLT